MSCLVLVLCEERVYILKYINYILANESLGDYHRCIWCPSVGGLTICVRTIISTSSSSNTLALGEMDKDVSDSLTGGE